MHAMTVGQGAGGVAAAGGVPDSGGVASAAASGQGANSQLGSVRPTPLPSGQILASVEQASAAGNSPGGVVGLAAHAGTRQARARSTAAMDEGVQ